MGLRGQKKHYFISLFVLIVLTGLILNYQNCSDTKLLHYLRLGSFTTGEFISALKPPEILNNDMRVMIFVDQSYSMIHGKCPTDLDGATPSLNGTACSNPQAGIDPAADRYAVIQQWLDELKARGNAKVALVPFSGGIKSRPFQSSAFYNETISDNAFLDLNSAQTRLDKLKAEHANDLAKPITDLPDFMGTSVPLPTLQLAKDIIYQEMKQLQNQGKLYKTGFRFIYASDGIFKPTDAIILKALSLAGCPATGGTSTCNIFRQDMYTYFGDPKDNVYQSIVDNIYFLANFPRYFGEGTIKVDLAQIHPEMIAPEDTNPVGVSPPTKNIFDQISKDLPKVGFTTIDSSIAPFKLFVGFAANTSYKLKSFYIVNLNALVDKYGSLNVDSDGDGIPDNEEVADGSDPRDPRTPDPSDGIRYCLDSITKKHGCKKIGCVTTFDGDGDGLNECEEATMATDAMKKDTDRDGVLDFLEITRGLDALSDDKQNDSNSDGYTNMAAFTLGAHPLADISNVDPQSLSNFSVYFKKYVPTQDANGAPAQVASYAIKVDNIPLVNTRATSVGSDLYYSKVPSPQAKITPDLLIGPSPHAANVNEILFVAEVQAIQDPNFKYWLFLRKQITPNGKNVTLNIDFSEFSQLKGTGD